LYHYADVNQHYSNKLFQEVRMILKKRIDTSFHESML